MENRSENKKIKIFYQGNMCWHGTKYLPCWMKVQVSKFLDALSTRKRRQREIGGNTKILSCRTYFDVESKERLLFCENTGDMIDGIYSWGVTAERGASPWHSSEWQRRRSVWQRHQLEEAAKEQRRCRALGKMLRFPKHAVDSLCLIEDHGGLRETSGNTFGKAFPTYFNLVF